MEFDIGNQFIGELFITSESKTLDLSNSDLFVDGRNKVKRQPQINRIVSQSVINLSG